MITTDEQGKMAYQMREMERSWQEIADVLSPGTSKRTIYSRAERWARRNEKVWPIQIGKVCHTRKSYTLEERQRAYELRAEGKSWPEVGEAMGLKPEQARTAARTWKEWEARAKELKRGVVAHKLETSEVKPVDLGARIEELREKIEDLRLSAEAIDHITRAVDTGTLRICTAAPGKLSRDLTADCSGLRGKCHAAAVAAIRAVIAEETRRLTKIAEVL